MKTDTGAIEKGNCEDQNNYICERPALTSKLSIIYFYLKIIVAIERNPFVPKQCSGKTGLSVRITEMYYQLSQQRTPPWHKFVYLAMEWFDFYNWKHNYR